MSDAAAPDNSALMDGVYRHQRHFYDLTRKYYLLGRDRLIARLDPPAGGHVLEIGCGTGRNLIAAARAHPQARYYGLDISAEMLSTARANVDKAGLTGRILLKRGDASDFDADTLFGRAHFDRVFFSYSLSMIPAWEAALVHADRLTSPAGGRMLAVDFGDQAGLPAWFRSGLRAWLKRFHVEPRDRLPEVLGRMKPDSAAIRTASLFRGYTLFAEIG